MKENILKIDIYSPIEKAFEFTIDPNNTSSWAYCAGEETVDAYPIKIGTVYSNNFSKLFVSDFIKNEVFELSEVNGPYIVRYIYESIEGGTRLTYKEWRKDDSILDEPFEFSNLEKLKQILEN